MKRKSILILLCLLFLGIALFSGYQLFLEWQEYAIGEQVYDDLSQYIQIEPTTPTETTAPPTGITGTFEPTNAATQPSAGEPTGTADPTLPEKDRIVWPVVDYESLREINSDVVAWIYIEGTNINYPVVQGWDNDYYLYRLFDGTYNSSGSIFMDYRNDQDLSDENTVLHGHHMRNMTMFAEITNYSDQTFYDDHPYAMLLTPDGNYLLEFFSGYVSDLDSSAWKMRFSSDSEYSTWLNRVASRSFFASDVNPTVWDRVVTLSTCTYDYDNARYVLHGVLRPAPQDGE